MKQITKEWMSAAKDDLNVIEKIIDDEHLSHIVAFHSQQCIEKVFKAIIEEYEIGLIRTHKLLRLYELVKDHITMEIDLVLLEKLDKLYVDSRYPGNLGLLPNGKPSLKDTKKFYIFSNDIYSSIEQYLISR